MKKILLQLIILASAINGALAIPADPTPKKVLQPDGSYLTVLMRGDEHSHLFYTEDGYPLYYNLKTKAFEYAGLNNGIIAGCGIMASDKDGRNEKAQSYLSSLNVKEIEKASMAKRASTMNKAPKRSEFLISDFPTTGRQKSLVVLFQFSDTKFTSIDDPKQFYTDMLNQEGFTWSNGANGSARDFYYQSSNGLFDPEFVVVGPVTLSRQATYYGMDDDINNDINMADAIEEACDLIDEEVDFTEFDTNGDGYVDNIYFFYAGGGQADDPNGTNYIWPHSAVMEEAWNRRLVYDGMVIGHYACSNELRYNTMGEKIPTGIGTFVHEFGHVLGLVDHYDTSYGYFTFCLGTYDTMATGSYNNNMNTPPLFSAFERAELAWLDYDILTNDADSITLIPELGASNKAFRVNVPGKENEFFVFENRQKTGFDTYLPGYGMLVWHIDQDKDAWDNNIVNINSTHQRIDIVEADGVLNEQTRDGDTFPGADNITTYDITSWDGDKLMSFDDVTLRNDTIRLLLAGTSFVMKQPENVSTVSVEDSCIVFEWAPVEDAKYYLVSVYTTGDDGENIYISDFKQKKYEAYGQIKVDGLEPDTEYNISVSAGLGSYVSDEQLLTVKTQDLAFVKRQPTGLTATEVKADGFKANWDEVRDADSYLITVRRHALSSTLSSDGYDFSNKADGMPEMWSTTSSLYYSVSGYYGESAPSLRLSSDDDNITVAYNETTLKGITFWCRAKNDGEKLHVETDNGDGQWSEVAVISPSVEGRTENFTFDACQRVRLRYERTSGFIVIDDIAASGYKMERIPVEGLNSISVGNVLSYDISGLEGGNTYSFCIQGVMGQEKSVMSEECKVTLPESTGINEVHADGNKSETIYDLSGRKMPSGNLPHGIYIINGKKIVK